METTGLSVVQGGLAASLFVVTERFLFQVYLFALLLKRDSNMFGSSVAEFDPTAFEMSVYQSPSTTYIESTTSGSEDSRIKAVAAKSPRAPKTGTFFSGVALIANRAISWVERGIENLGKIISAYRYWKASEESMLSVKLAIASSNPGFIKAQFMHLEECRKRQYAYLESQDASFAKGKDDRFYSKLNILIAANRGVLREHSEMMKRQSVCFQSCIPGRTEPEQREFHKASTMINVLLAQGGSRLIRKQQQEAKGAEPKNKKPGVVAHHA